MTVQSMKTMAGHDVVAVDNAEDIGSIKHFVVARDVSRIERLHIDGRKKNAVFAEWDQLESFGGDRVMVTAADAPSTSDDERDVDAAKGDIEILGSRVLDTAGFEHGKVDDVDFETDTGEIVSISTSEGAVIDADRARSLGSYALIVDA